MERAGIFVSAVVSKIEVIRSLPLLEEIWDTGQRAKWTLNWTETVDESFPGCEGFANICHSEPLISKSKSSQWRGVGLDQNGKGFGPI